MNELPSHQEILATLREVKITGALSYWHSSPRPKMVGKNARFDVHGNKSFDFFLRISTNQGFEGFGVGRATKESLRAVQGYTLDRLWHENVGVISPLGRADHALYDLVGKVLGVPSWRLLGGRGPEWVPIYDSSIYFADLQPENEGKGVAPLLAEIDESVRQGHRAFKIKIGRGHKWMPEEEGFRRDIEVIQAVRKQVGPDVKLMVDSNNTYGIEATRRFLDEVGDEFLFLEEMFEEHVPDNLELKAYLRDKGFRSFVADGESAQEVIHFEPYVAAAALDVLQPDIRVFGTTLCWQIARLIEGKPVHLATHNWGSMLALYPQVSLGRGVPNLLIAEHDPAQSKLFDTSSFTFKEGKVRVPDEPGGGVRINEEEFRRIYGSSRQWAVGSTP